MKRRQLGQESPGLHFGVLDGGCQLVPVLLHQGQLLLGISDLKAGRFPGGGGVRIDWG